MIFDDFKNFAKQIDVKGRIIGLDVGRKNIGVALSDRDKNIATPKFILKRKSTLKDLQILKKFIEENNVCAIVSGIPLNSNGNEVNNCKYIVDFVKKLDEIVNMPIFFENEFLSSFMVEDMFIDEMGVSYKNTKNVVDKSAAAIILQSTLERLKTHINKT